MTIKLVPNSLARETVGKLSSDLIIKVPDTLNPVEQMGENLSEYEQNIWDCVERCKKAYPGSFYVIVITKNEKLMPNVFRNYFYGRLSAPTPDYDQTLYRYDHKEGKVGFVWVIPSKDACIYLKSNALYVEESERGLLKYVLEFADGTLFKLAKKMNGEKEESILLEDGKPDKGLIYVI